jgi:PTS system mannose-specific IIA component/fructoselysine and glucoselysine-specific PTS system IIA component
MKNFILASHGKLAEGILNSVEMIIGKQQNVDVFSLKPGEHPQEIIDSVEKMILDAPDRKFIVITDIMGGSVHMTLSKLLEHEHVYLISGMNLSMLLELFLVAENQPMEEAIRDILDRAKNGIVFANDLFKETCEKGGEDEWLNC